MNELKKYICYPDNNMLIDHEKGIDKLPINDKLEYVYSYVHLEELLEAGNKIDEIKEIRLATLEKLTRGLYVENDREYKPAIDYASPYDKYIIINNPISRLILQELHRIADHWKVDENPTFLMQKFGIEKIKINNYSPRKIIDEFGSIISNYVKTTSSNKQTEFQSFFNILDALGIWQDKVIVGSTMNRSYDANHAYFATACDYFITNDKKTRNKANIVYEILGYNTKAISFNEFIETTKK